jgi:hypothetical protein
MVSRKIQAMKVVCLKVSIKIGVMKIEVKEIKKEK